VITAVFRSNDLTVASRSDAVMNTTLAVVDATDRGTTVATGTWVFSRP
jgi:hypothetical protein